MGCKYIKDVKAPLSNVRILAVGGVDENNMKNYLDAGACGIGIGSGIVKKSMIDAGVAVAEFIAVNTDDQALDTSCAAKKITIGEKESYVELSPENARLVMRTMQDATVNDFVVVLRAVTPKLGQAKGGNRGGQNRGGNRGGNGYRGGNRGGQNRGRRGR